VRPVRQYVKGDWALCRAEDAYRCALSQSPGDGEIHLQLGRLFELTGRTEQAAEAHEEARRRSPGSAIRSLDSQTSERKCHRAAPVAFWARRSEKRIYARAIVCAMRGTAQTRQQPIKLRSLLRHHGPISEFDTAIC
jgi:hypothetical protein